MTTLNPSDKKNSSVVLSNGNLTVTGTDAGGNNWVRSTTAVTGKRYVEFTATTVSNTVVGVADLSAMTFPGADAKSVGLFSNGFGSIAGAFPDWSTPYSSSNILGMAIDLTAKKIWWRVGSGNWNGSSSNNPATGTGGFDISSYTGTPHYLVCSGANGCVTTVNFGASAFANAAPSGFVAWDASPFTDSFDRADQNLETSVAWTHDGLITGGLTISSSKLNCTTSNSTGTAYKCPDQGHANHYVKYTMATVSAASGPFVCCRLADVNNFVGVRYDSGAGIFEVFKRVGGTLTNLGNLATSVTVGDVIKFECFGDDWRLDKNGVNINSGSIGDTGLNSTRQGLVARAVVTTSWIDNFEAGVEVVTNFSDNFNRSNANLESSATSSSGHTWRHDGIVSGGLIISSNQIACNTTSSGTLYYVDLGTAQQVVFFTVRDTTPNSFVALRATNIFKYVGVRASGSNLQIYRNDTGYTNIYDANHSIASGDILECRVTGSDIQVLRSGISLVSMAIGATYTGTRVGIHARQAVQNPLLDDFSASAASVSTGKIKAWSGSAWNIKPMKIWTGSAWATKAVKMWDGTAWITIQDAVATPPPSISLVQSNEGYSATNETTVSFASTPAAGNLIVMSWSGNDYHYLQNTDAGWFQANEAEYNQGVYTWWRIADGSTNGWTYTLDSTVRSLWMLAEFTGIDQIDVAASRWSAESSATTLATPSIVPTSGERLLIAHLAASDGAANASSDGDWTGWTNSFTHIRSKAYSSSTPVTMSSLAYRVVTGDDSTSYSTAATLPSSKDTLLSYTEIVAFKAVGNQTATTAPNFRAVSSIGYASRTNTTVDKPTGTVDNDIMLALLFQGNATAGGLAAITPPSSGWKLLLQSFPYVNEGTGFYGKLWLYWKRASSEGANYTWTHSANSTQCAITSWSGCVTTGTPIDSWTYNSAGNLKGSGRFGSICTNSTNYRFVALDHNWSGSATGTIGGDWTEHYDTTLLKIQSRTMTGRGDSTNITRVADSPWEGYLVALRGV